MDQDEVEGTEKQGTKMTALQSFIRLGIYVLIAMLTTASAGLFTVEFADQKQVWGFALSIILSGLVTARSYIDKSPNDVNPPKP